MTAQSLLSVKDIFPLKKDGVKKVREFGIEIYTLLYLKWITNKDFLSSAWNSAQCYVAAWVGGGFGGEWIHVYVGLSPIAIHLKLSQYCLLALPQYKIKSLRCGGKKK